MLSLRAVLLGSFWVSTCMAWPSDALAQNRAPSRQLAKLRLNGQTIEAAPLLEGSDGVLMLGRDGAIFQISLEVAGQSQLTTGRFTPASRSALRNQLQQEFGNAYDVTATSHYLVVHPNGNGSQWSERFEELYRSFGHYFKLRGFEVREPEFPLIAIVLPSRTEFERYAKSKGDKIPNDALGYYSPMSNRVALYDVSGGTNQQAWQENATTIIHEATHQTAFNTGIHQRLFPTPNWIVEGLGTMFEAEGVWNARYNTRSSDRVNADRLDQFKQYLGRRKKDAFVQLLAGDRMFRDDPHGAYAESWAWCYYLMETRPRQFASYLRKIAARGELAQYSPTERLKDFTAEFGSNLDYLDAQFVRHMKSVK